MGPRLFTQNTGFVIFTLEDGVDHAVTVTPAAGQQKTAAAVGGLLQGNDLAGNVAKGPLQHKVLVQGI
jgi:hypothetical protein